MKEKTKIAIHLATRGLRSIEFVYNMSPVLTVLMFVTTIILPFTEYVVAINTAEILNKLQRGDGSSVKHSLIFICLMFGLGGLLSILSRNIVVRFNLKYHQYFEQKKCEKKVELDIGKIKSKSYEDIVQKINDNPYRWEAIREYVLHVFKMFTLVTSFGIAVYVLARVDWKVAAVLTAFVIPEFVSDIYFSRRFWSLIDKLVPKSKLRNEYLGQFSGTVGITESRLLGSYSYLLKNIDKIWSSNTRERVRHENIKTRFSILTTFIGISGFGYAIFSIVNSAQIGLIELGTMSLAIGYIGILKSSTSSVLNNIATQFEIARYAKLVFEFFDLKPSIKGNGLQVHLPISRSPTIRFEDVWFHYPDKKDDWVLQDINLVFKAGDRIGIFGENGSGKSSLLSLITRIYDPIKGRITIDGIDLKSIDPDYWQNYLSVLTQNNSSYSLQIGESIRLACNEREVDDGEILEVATYAKANETIAKHGGLYAQIGTKFGGIELSGGEKKRLAILMRMIRKRNIAIFDEPEKELSTSACATLFRQLRDLDDNILAIYVSHNISTLKLARTILVMSEGKVVDVGSHDELISRENLYKQAFDQQVKTLIGSLEGFGYEISDLLTTDR